MKYAKKPQVFIIVGSIFVGWLTYGFHSGIHKSNVNQPVGLQGEAAYERLKQDHLYYSLQAAVSAARYRIYADEKTENTFYANNSAQQLTACFMPDAASISVKHSANSDRLRVTELANELAPAQSEQSQLSLKFIGAGYGDAIHFAQEQPAITTADNRLTYTHQLSSNHDSTSGWLSLFAKSAIGNRQSAIIEEWFVNKPEGIEHGFTVSEPVGESREGERLRIALELTGNLEAEASSDGQAIVLKDADGETVLSYDHLKAFDANGRELAARMRADDAGILIEVDDLNAIYPITIDPVFAGQPKLTAPDGAASDQLGFSLATDGGTIVVGAPFDDDTATDQGSAYVFVRTGGSLSFQSKLTAGDASANDNFGYSVAIYADTVVVGALHDDSGPFTDSGSAYVFIRNGSSWSQQAKLTPSDAASNDEFGCSVGIGNINDVIVGARLDDIGSIADQGSAYVFVRSGATWSQQQKLTEQTGGFTNDQFGYAVAIGQNRVVVGSPFDNAPAPNQGSAYIFVRSGVPWIQHLKLTSNTGLAGDSFGIAVALDSNSIVVGSHLDDIDGTPDQGSAFVYSSNGALQQQLIAGDGLTGDAFGFSVAVAGNTIVIGASFDDVGVNLNQGSAYVFSHSGTFWTLEQRLTAADGAANDFVGVSVSISRTGETITLGAYLADVASNTDQGSVSVFFQTNATWTEQEKLTANDGAADPEFGVRVAISGDTVVVGAPRDDAGFSNQGSAYVFVRSGTTWMQQQKLTALDGAPNDFFGWSVAINDVTVVVGAADSDVGANTGQGSAYVFARSGASWTQQQKLTALDGAPNDFFGSSSAISGDTIIVTAVGDDVAAGEAGSAYVFVRSGVTWSEHQKLTANDGEAGDFFGRSVAINGDTVVVSADSDDFGANSNQGSAYVFTRSGTTWTQQQKLTALDGAANDQFSASVAVSDDTVVVGAIADDIGPNSNQGSAYVFVRSGTSWMQQQKLTALDGAPNEVFGNSVAITGNTVVVGANGDEIGPNSNQGSVYVFVRSGTTWTQQQKLTVLDGAPDDFFGRSVSISGDTFIVGAHKDDVTFANQGSAYIFSDVPNEFVVANTTDSGARSLRQAILDANANPGLDIIKFSTGTGLQTINLSTSLPAITDPLVIDGTTQPGYTGTPLIEVTGIGIPASNDDGLVINASFCTIKGLAITRFSGNGIELGSSANNTLITANHIGVDPTGTSARPNGGNGILALSANNQIGGTTTPDRNIISGNIGNGIELGSSNRVLGNYIGTAINGTSPLGNSQHGIFIADSSGNQIGGTAEGEANTIAFNGGDGVCVQEGVSNTIRGNSIHSNGGLGIDLGLAEGVTPNDAGDGDFDGGNLAQNFPVITLAQQGSTIIQGTLNSAANTAFTLDFYSNPTADPTNHGEGQTYIGATTVTTDPGGNASFNVPFPATTPVGHAVSGTATDPNGNTSEFGQVRQVTPPAAANSISGTISYCIDRGKKVPNATVATTSGSPSDTTTTNASGFYQLDNLGIGPYAVAPSKTGAVSGISAFDAALVAQFAAGLATPSSCQQLAGDASNNGALSAFDAGLIAQTAAAIPNAGIAGTWKFSPSSRSYPSLSGNLINENYDAVLVGDVSGNWAPAGPQGPGTTPSGGGNVAVALPDQAAAPGSTNVMVPVFVDNTTGQGVIAYDFTFTFNTSVIQIANPVFETTGTLSAGWNITPNTSTAGQIRIVAFNTTALSGSGPLIFLKFNVSGSQGAMTPLNWTNFVFNEGTPTATLTNGKFTASAPSAVKLEKFTATGYDGGVYLEWKTGLEVDNLGFNIYRERAGQKELVNPQTVAGSALLTGQARLQSGRTYKWWDSRIADCGSPNANCRETRYWLEDVDLDGSREMHGPFTINQVGGKPESLSSADVLSQVGGSATKTTPARFARLPVRSEAQLLKQQQLASEPALKLTIREEGFYSVSRQELLAAGLGPDHDPLNLQLYVNGHEVPMLVAGEKGNSFDAIEFYATGQDSPATDAHTYWLVAGKTPGKRINIVKGGGKAGGAPSFSYTVEKRDRTIYFSALRNGEEENFFGAVITAQVLDQKLDLRHIDTEGRAAELEVALQGVTTTPSNHSVSVAVNGVFVGKLIFNAREHKSVKFSLHQSYLKEGDNTITLQAEGGQMDVSLVDYIRLTYQHTYRAEGNELKLVAGKTGNPAGETDTQTASGFTNSSIRVIDVSDPSSAEEIAGSIDKAENGYQVTVNVAGNETRTLLAFTADRMKRAVKIAANQPSSLRSRDNGADLLVLTRSDLIESLQPLVELRQKQGLSVLVIDVEDILDEFSYGERSTRAVKEFISHAATSWKKKPRFILMAGDGTFDPKGYLGVADGDVVATRLIDTHFMETASDEWFVDFNNDGIGELAIGRLPMRDSSEAAVMVGKIISYEQARPSEEVMLVSDSNDGFNFESASNELRGLIPAGLRVNLINRGSLDADTAKKRLLEGLNRGQKVVNYMGHGNVDQWRGDLLTNDNVRGLENGERLSVFVMMTCLNGYYEDPLLSGLAEELMRSGRGGAVAVWASSGMTLPTEQVLINQQLYRTLFGKTNLTLGEHVRFARLATSDTDVRRSWILFGDPTLRIK